MVLSANRQITIANQGILSFAAGYKGSSLTPDAPYVVLGSTFQLPSASGEAIHLGSTVVAPKSGNGALLVQANTLIDVGDLSVQNASTVTLSATYQGQNGTATGAIRGDGTLDVAGNITHRADQIYPPTETTFNIIAASYTDSSGALVPGTVNILPGGGAALPSLPLSADGTLNIYASVINQGGVLRAPLGVINLGAGSGAPVDPLSGQSVPMTSTLNLQPGSITSVSAIDSAMGQDNSPPALTCEAGATFQRTSSCRALAGPMTFCRLRPRPIPAPLPSCRLFRMSWRRLPRTRPVPLH